MAALAIVIAIVTGAFYWYFTWSQKQIRTLVENQAVLELSISEQKEAIELQTISIQIQSKKLNTVNENVNVIRKESSDLRKLFARHDFSELVKNKPKLTERLQNKASKKLFQDFNELTDPRTYK